jgi:CxxC-x17-CxxC domain-containing protein
VSFTDKVLTCRDCGTEFVFTAGEQEFYQQKGFDNAPTRCPSCRRARKAQRSEGGNYSSGGYSSDGGSYSSGGYGGAQRERIQHEVVCSQCGRTTTVPFVPRGDRPVYCNDCFAQQRGTSRGAGRGGYNRY